MRDLKRVIAIPIDSMPGAELLINDRLGMRIKHPGCDTLAFIIVASDVIYCLACDLRAKPSGIWPASPPPTEVDRPSYMQLQL